jgi:hypothetical protein
LIIQNVATPEQDLCVCDHQDLCNEEGRLVGREDVVETGLLLDLVAVEFEELQVIARGDEAVADEPVEDISNLGVLQDEFAPLRLKLAHGACLDRQLVQLCDLSLGQIGDEADLDVEVGGCFRNELVAESESRDVLDQDHMNTGTGTTSCCRSPMLFLASR